MAYKITLTFPRINTYYTIPMADGNPHMSFVDFREPEMLLYKYSLLIDAVEHHMLEAFPAFTLNLRSNTKRYINNLDDMHRMLQLYKFIEEKAQNAIDNP